MYAWEIEQIFGSNLDMDVTLSFILKEVMLCQEDGLFLAKMYVQYFSEVKSESSQFLRFKNASKVCSFIEQK